MALDLTSFKDDLITDLTTGKNLTQEQLDGLEDFIDKLGNRLEEYVKTGTAGGDPIV